MHGSVPSKTAYTPAIIWGELMRMRKDKNFMSYFNEKTGEYVRTGIWKEGRDTWEDPFKASFPELLDIGIMGHCKHGSMGLCQKAGVECYQDGLHACAPNMTLEDFEQIAKQCEGETFQFALGGCGDPDQHEHFEEILKICHEAKIVPNFTTSGLGMTEEIAQLCKKYCGAVAVSWYRSKYTKRALKLLTEAGVKTNVHYVLSKDTLEEAFKRLEDGFGADINAVVFLLHKPVGLGTKEQMIATDNGRFWELLEYIDTHEFPFKTGFDSCTVPAVLCLGGVDKKLLDTCEGGRWSAYISADMKMMPCSFDNQQKRWAVDLREHTIKEAWDSPVFDDFREHFRTSCPDCPQRESCMGGCPIVPEIVLCKFTDFLHKK